MRETIYISGKITNNPNYIREFFEAENYLRDNRPFAKIINPAVLGAELERQLQNPTYNDHMKHDVLHLLNCNAIFMMKNWEHSPGAKAEHALAIAMKMNIHYQSELGEAYEPAEIRK